MTGLPFIVTSAPNGARLQKADHPGLPITAAEIGAEAQALVEAGVSILHLHVRDSAGRHSIDSDLYRTAIRAVRESVGDQLIIQVTSESVGMFDRHEQMAMVRELRPEAVSLALRELCPDESTLEEASRFFGWCCAEKIWPQYILYSPEDVARFEDYRRRGVFGEEYPGVLFVLGRYASDLTGDPVELEAFLAAAGRPDYPWSVCCFGRTEHIAIERAFQLGGHGRIGFENNRWLPGGEQASSNAELVLATLDPLDKTRRPIAGVDWVRENLVNRD